MKQNVKVLMNERGGDVERISKRTEDQNYVRRRA